MMNNKAISIFILLVLIVSVLTACTVNSGGEDISTTAVTDSKGTTHYYEPVTDDKGNISTTSKDQGVFAEIETESNGKAVTKIDGTYVTKEHTTIMNVTKKDNGKTTSAQKQKQSTTTKVNVSNNTNSTTKKTSSTSVPNNNSNADNDVPFETTSRKNATTTTTEESPLSTSTTKSSTTTAKPTTTEKTTQSFTDEDGWINKWY